MSMVEVRKNERVRSFLRARIVFNNQNTTIECIVKNISRSGAKIQLDNSLSLPTHFDLDIPQRGKTYRSRMVWRDADALGVSFIEVAPDVAAPAEPRDLLEMENRKLKVQLAKLKKRLEDLGQDVSFDP